MNVKEHGLLSFVLCYSQGAVSQGDHKFQAVSNPAIFPRHSLLTTEIWSIIKANNKHFPPTYTKLLHEIHRLLAKYLRFFKSMSLP